MNYKPKPLDISKIILPNNLIRLVEKIAKNIHEIWANERILDGWTYGTVRDDKKKTNPCLVPYKNLPENEKKYDKKIAEETIKAILLLKYKIIKIKKDK